MGREMEKQKELEKSSTCDQETKNLVFKKIKFSKFSLFHYGAVKITKYFYRDYTKRAARALFKTRKID